MTIPTHRLHIYQKPTAGNRFISRHLTYNYQHSISAIGGFDTASCDIALRSVSEGQEFLDQFLGNRVAIYVDNPIEPIWEGFINRITLNSGLVQYSIGLDEMANRVRCVYCATNGNSAITQTAVTNDTGSQGLFGIKQAQVDLGYMQGGVGVTILRDTVLAQRAWPKSSITRGSGGDTLLHIEMLGFYHTLKWEDYRQAASANAQLGNIVDAILAALVNGTTFLDNADTTETAANTSVIDQQTIRGETAWDALMKVQETGDTTNYYVLGVTPTLFRTGTRRLYYRQASSTITYTARQSDGLRVRNRYGQLISPWLVKPDSGIRISDNLIGWNGIGDNPTESYIMDINYNANEQSVDWRGDDDLTAEGAFNVKRFNKSYGKNFGQARRVS